MRALGILLALLLPAGASAGADLGGIVSIYTQPMYELLTRWRTLAPAAATSREVQIGLTCYATPAHELYIGTHQELRIQASLAEVRAVLDDFPHYPELFAGMVKAEPRERTASRMVVHSELEIPIPFVANERNELIYELGAPAPDRFFYRYQLRKSSHLTANDGLIALRALGPTETEYQEWDFWDANWGIARAFAKGKIWRDNVAGLVQADLAIKLRAEHPEWKFKRIFDESRSAAGRKLAETCTENRVPFALPLAGSPAPQ